jgi:hypothetical protein
MIDGLCRHGELEPCVKCVRAAKDKEIRILRRKVTELETRCARMPKGPLVAWVVDNTADHPHAVVVLPRNIIDENPKLFEELDTDLFNSRSEGLREAPVFYCIDAEDIKMTISAVHPECGA